MNYVTRRPPKRLSLPGSFTAGRQVTVSSTGRPYPVGTVSTNVVPSATTVLFRDHWPVARRSRPLPAPLFGGNHGHRPLWVYSPPVSYMTFTWPWPLRTCETDSFTYFLADRTNGRAIATVFRLSVCRLSVTLCIVAKRCVLEQKLLWRAYRKSYMGNRLVPKWMTLNFVKEYPATLKRLRCSVFYHCRIPVVR